MSFNVTLTNNSGTASSDISWICYGLDGDPGTGNPSWSYISVDSKTKKASLKKFTLGQKCAPLFNTIDSLGSFTDLPPMWSGQFIFCFGGLPKVFNIVKGDRHGIGVQTPPFTPGSADANTIFAVVEFTYTGGTISCDSTIVDYFSAPISLKVVGDTTATNGIMKTKSTRASIFDALIKLGKPWSNLVMQDKVKKKNIRVLGPQHAVATTSPNMLSPNIYDNYIDAIWTNYDHLKSNKLTVNCPTFGTYVGQVENKQFVFTQSGKPNVVIDKPGPGKAADIFGCVGTLNAPNNTPLGELAAIFGAALNRTTINTNGSDTQPNCDVSKFYQVVNGVTNEYAKAVHDNYQSGIYAFPFDDVCSTDSPLINVNNPTQITIDISAWS